MGEEKGLEGPDKRGGGQNHPEAQSPTPPSTRMQGVVGARSTMYFSWLTLLFSVVSVYTVSNTYPQGFPALTATTRSGPALLSTPKSLKSGDLLLLCFIEPSQGGEEPG